MPISILYLNSAVVLLSDQASSTGFFFLKLFSLIVIFIFIMIAAFYTTKFIGKHGLTLSTSRNLRVIEKLPLGVDKMLLIVRAGSDYYLLASTKQRVTLLDKLERDNLIEEIENSSDNVLKTKFSSYFDKIASQKSKISVEEEQTFELQYDDDFTESLKSRLADLKKRSDEMKGFSDKDENK